MLGMDFEPMFSVFEISDTESCQRSRINVNGTRVTYLHNIGVFAALLMKSILTFNLAHSHMRLEVKA